MKARIDRAFANLELLNMFAYAHVRHISTTESDHCFVKVDLHEHAAEGRSRANKQFRYEDMWQCHADYD